ncbi:MAG: hydrogenase 3 maturation protease [Methanocella sp. PtaU1.Bin125]|nr:MAG: hydrogenase 3 maturation protease [Methanocella sp. PtaU1.Bin125]
MDRFSGLEAKLKARVGDLSPEKVVFVGVGNRSRGDDAVGPAVIDMLADRVPQAIDAGPAPENVTGLIKRLKPSAVVFIDALLFRDLPPGTPAIVETGDIRHLGESTHTLSLDVVMEYLKAETGADVFMIGVQPERIADGEGMTPGLETATEKIASAIASALKKG